MPTWLHLYADADASAVKDPAKKRARDLRYWHSRWPERRQQSAEKHRRWKDRELIIKRLAWALATIAALCGPVDAQSLPDCAYRLWPDCGSAYPVGPYIVTGSDDTGDPNIYVYQNIKGGVAIATLHLDPLGSPTSTLAASPTPPTPTVTTTATPSPTFTPIVTRTATSTPTAIPVALILLNKNKAAIVSFLMNGKPWRCLGRLKQWSCSPT